MTTAKETILLATAFTYGYSKIVAIETNDWNQAERIKRLALELKTEKCFGKDGKLIEPYHSEQIKGESAAKAFLEQLRSGYNYTSDF